MLAVKDNDLISVEDYLKGEPISEVKHELVDGYVYVMAGASENHDRISVNVLSEFRNHLKNSPCEPFTSDMKLKINENFFYPDCMVICDKDDENKFYKNKPIIIVEVLSRSTRKKDETLKLMSYINIPSLQEYIMIEQDIVDITVLRRSEGWFSKHYFLGDEITFESIGLTLSVEEIYHRVQNEDMVEFLNTKNGQ